MASKQVLKLCERIKNEFGVICKPDTFHPIREQESASVWIMDVDVDNSTGFTEWAYEQLDYCTICVSPYYMKDLLKCDKLMMSVCVDGNEVKIIPENFKYLR